MKRTTPITLALTVAAFACSDVVAPVPPAQERVLLEIEYINYAWFPTFFGFFMEADGEVYKYDRKGTIWGGEGQDTYTAAELSAKFALNRTLLETRGTSEVQSVAAKVDVIAGQPLSQPKEQCADAGVLTYRAYKFDTASGKYRAILLRAEGDFAQENTSAAAQDLIAYVRSLGLMEELLGCDP